MAQTQTTTAIVAGLETDERFFDHFEVEVWQFPNYTLVASDTFVRANESPLNPANWYSVSGTTGFRIISNEGLPTNSGGLALSVYAGASGSFNPDQYAECSLTVLANNSQFAGPVVRCQTNIRTCYWARITGPIGGSSVLDIMEVTNGVQVSLLTISLSTASGDVIRLEVVGPTLTVKQNGVVVASTTDSTIANGLPGVGAVLNGVTTNLGINNFAAGNIGGTSAPNGTLVLGPYHIAGKWVAASGLWIQQDPLYVRGLTLGQIYAFRARVQIKSGGPPSSWTPFAQITAGDTTPPSQTYSPTVTVTAAGLVVQSNPVSPVTDTNHYEFFTDTSGSTPPSSQPPNLPSSTDGSLRILIGDNDAATIWIRAVDTSGNRAAWTSLGIFNSNGALLIASGGSTANLINNPSFESNRGGYTAGLVNPSSQYVSDGWVAIESANSGNAFKAGVENGGPFPRTGQNNGWVQLQTNQAIASGGAINASLAWPGDTTPGRNKLFPVRGGDYYYFGGWARWDASLTLPGNVAGSVFFLVSFFNSSGGLISTVQTAASITSASGGYQFLSGTATVPTSAAFIQFQCVGQIQVTSGSFNTGSAGIYMNARFEDVFVYKATRGSHGSYRPLSNPLTGHDAGSSATVNIAAFTMRCGSTDLSISSGAVTALAYNTLYFIYYDDPDFLGGGSVVFNATTTKETAIQGEARYFVGSIQTPRAGALDTIGNNDGGAGSQNGMLNTLFMSVTTTSALNGNGSVVNVNNVIDGDFTTAASFSVSGNGAGNSAIIFFSGPASINRRYKSLTLKVIFSVAINTLNGQTGPTPPISLLYSTSGPFGNQTTFVSYGNNGGPQPVQLASVVLPAGTNPAQVILNVQVTCQGGTGNATSGTAKLYVYESWLEGLE